MAEQHCLSLHGLTAASKTRCYIYLKACQVFALILAYLQEGMCVGIQDKSKGLLKIDRGHKHKLKDRNKRKARKFCRKTIYRYSHVIPTAVGVMSEYL